MGVFYYHTIRLPFYLGDLNCELKRTFRSTLDEDSPRPVLPLLGHNHVFAELQYILQGSCVFYSDSTRLTAAQGTLVYVPPEVDHRLSDPSPDLCRLIVVIQILPPAAPRPDSPSMELYNTLRPSVPVIFKTAELPELAAPLSAFIDVQVEGRLPFTRKEFLRANAPLLLLAIADAISKDPKLSSLPHRSLTTQQAIIEIFFSDNYFRMATSAEDLAKQLHVSPRQLDRILKAYYGMGFREKLNAVRLNQAALALTTTDAPIRQISDSLGFSCVTAFGTFIKGQTGMTPSQLRRSHLFASPDSDEA